MVKLHKVTVYVVEPGGISDEIFLDRLYGDCAHNAHANILKVETVDFDREWTEGDPLNMTYNLENREYLEGLIRDGIS